MSATRIKKGFTLIEILIVVIILGILAAIVIPQFSNASTAAKTSSVLSTAQTLRSQVALYRLQHNDQLPTQANFWSLMTSYTLVNGTTTSAGTTGAIPPYMQSVPNNALYGGSTITDVAGVSYPQTLTSTTAWAYDYNSGTGSGRVYGTDTDGKTIVGP